MRACNCLRLSTLRFNMATRLLPPPAKNLSRFWVNPENPEQLSLQGAMGITDNAQWRACTLVHLDINKTYNDNKLIDQHEYMSAAEYVVPELKKYECRWPAEQFAPMFCQWTDKSKICAVNSAKKKLGSLLKTLKDRKKVLETTRADAARRKQPG
ncbi:hypothetical protein K466DRAFT_606817 [Polyporus arcularius HHB13444]|uniref:Uncharacterized protein n=1 Tax=Polyporus arcularius HHB13444 TaxID=1314778 RepID=A0A5C3NLM5_9APHY|nr:hypothetical protein K466DRAFT_606817 [Polyporus arcularius HHB13444]